MLALTVGYPGSGKSAWASRFRGRLGFLVVDRGDIRRTLIGRDTPGDPDQETVVSRLAYAAVNAGLSQGLIVVHADRNLSQARRKPFLDLAGRLGKAAVLVSFMDVPAPECARRDARRERPAGSDVVLGAAVDWPRAMVERYMAETGLPVVDPDSAERLMMQWRSRNGRP